MCFGFVDDSLQVVQKEYFSTYQEALDFEKTAQNEYEAGVSITPMNEKAEKEMKIRR